jgi:hypothetical protein
LPLVQNTLVKVPFNTHRVRGMYYVDV